MNTRTSAPERRASSFSSLQPADVHVDYRAASEAFLHDYERIVDLTDSEGFSSEPLVAVTTMRQARPATSGDPVPLRQAYRAWFLRFLVPPASPNSLKSLSAQLDDLYEHPRLTMFPEPVPPPTRKAYAAAVAVLEAAEDVGLPPVRVTLTAATGFAVWFRPGRQYAVIECRNDGSLVLLWNHPQTGLDNWQIRASSLSLHQTLDRVAGFLAAADAR